MGGSAFGGSAFQDPLGDLPVGGLPDRSCMWLRACESALGSAHCSTSPDAWAGVVEAGRGGADDRCSAAMAPRHRGSPGVLAYYPRVSNGSRGDQAAHREEPPTFGLRNVPTTRYASCSRRQRDPKPIDGPPPMYSCDEPLLSARR